jgi:hypothetical protein
MQRSTKLLPITADSCFPLNGIKFSSYIERLNGEKIGSVNEPQLFQSYDNPWAAAQSTAGTMPGFFING